MLKIKIFGDGPLEPALVKIAEVFRRDSGHEAQFVFGLSPVIHKKVIDGEWGDAIVIQPNFIDELVRDGKVVAGQHSIVTRVGIGLLARAGTPARDVSTPEKLKRVLLSADSLVFNNVASGNFFAKILERLGIADAIKDKTTRTTPADVVARVLQDKGNTIGVGTTTLIIANKRLALVGALPSELQSRISYAAALMTNSQQPEAAKAFISLLASRQSKDTFAAAEAN
jgi:molybdate transport system substrate-binding protein